MLPLPPRGPAACVAVGLFVSALCAAFAADAFGEVRKTEHSAVELIAEQASLPSAGGVVTVGFYLTPDPGWHAYWINPGDAGKEPSIRWSLPEGFAAEPLRFPAPELIPYLEFNTYGFNDPVLLLADISVPEGLAAGASVEIAGRARWVVCDDEVCIPEQVQVALTLPVGDGAADPRSAPRFALARRQQPVEADWPARFWADGSRIVFHVEPPQSGIEPSYLFVAPRRVVQYGVQERTRAGGGWQFAMDAAARAAEADTLQAVLRYADADGRQRAVELDFDRSAPPAPSAAAVAASDVGGAGAAMAGADAFDVLKAVLFGILGGILLNLMPCVFPILSMKALGVVELSRSGERAARISGIYYTVGVLATFLAIAALLIVLRAAGEAAGWGFQLQSPWVILFLALVMVAIGLNLFGAYEVGLRAMGIGQGIAPAGERRKAMLTGSLAVIVATPCTAPFMAGALGFALVQPAPVAVAVFLALGLGLAAPYLLVTFVPSFGRLLPKPGAWMETFRRVLAFPMFATAVWLFWVLGRQLGATAMALAMLAALLLAFALWAYGRGRAARWRIAAVAGLAACVVAGAATARIPSPDNAPEHRLGTVALESFTPERVLGYIAAQQPVFVYFTADWCISCKVNERVALATDIVGRAFRERGIKVVEADWTTEDPVITEWLERYDRAGVPLYLYFPRGSSLETAVILPQLLLPGLVVETIDAADAAAA